MLTPPPRGSPRICPAGPDSHRVVQKNRSSRFRSGRELFRLLIPTCCRRARTPKAVLLRLWKRARTAVRSERANSSTNSPLEHGLAWPPQAQGTASQIADCKTSWTPVTPQPRFIGRQHAREQRISGQTATPQHGTTIFWEQGVPRSPPRSRCPAEGSRPVPAPAPGSTGTGPLCSRRGRATRAGRWASARKRTGCAG